MSFIALGHPCENASTPEGPHLIWKEASTVQYVPGSCWPLVINTLVKQHMKSLPEDVLAKNEQGQLGDAVMLINVKEMNSRFLLLLC